MGMVHCPRHGLRPLTFVAPAIAAEAEANRFWDEELFLLQLRLGGMWGWHPVDAGFLTANGIGWTDPFRTVIIDDEDRSWALLRVLTPICEACAGVTLTKRSRENHPARWAQDRLDEFESHTIRSSIRVAGVHETPATRWMERQSAIFDVMVAPAPAFHVTNLLPKDHPLRAMGLTDQFVYGMLDILMTAGERKIDRMHVMIEDAKTTRMVCSDRAARLAGRDAGRKIFAAQGDDAAA